MRADYVRLLAQIRKVAAELLPEVSPTARYNDGQVLRMYAFRLSAHAEVEGFLELCANSIITHLSAKLTSRAGLSHLLQRTILLHDHMKESFPPRSLSVIPHPKKTPKDRILSCLNAHGTVVSQNNGVSEKDILKLFVPLGFNLESFDLSWLTSMTALTRARGEAAHNSWLGGTIVQPTPQGERQLLVRPLLGMRNLVDQVEHIKALA